VAKKQYMLTSSSNKEKNDSWRDLMDEVKSIHINKAEIAESALSASVGRCQKYSQQITVA